MGPLLLLTGVFLHLTRSTHSAESGVNVRAGDDVKITCTLDSKLREWRWAPRYPRCVTTGSTEVVINRSSAHSLWDGRLAVTENKRELKLKNTRVNDSGTFYCVGEDKISSFNLTVIHESGVNASDYGEDHEVTISCYLDSKDPVREWRWAPRYPSCVSTGSKEVVIYSPSVHPSWVDGTDPFLGRLVVPENKRELTLLNPRVNDSGTFTCVSEDNKPSSDHLSFSAYCNPEPTRGSDRLGQPMKLSCCESQDPVTWLLDGQAVRNSSGLRFFRNGAVTIQKLGPEHRGLWRCLDEEGDVLVELCLEVWKEQYAPVAAQTTSAPPGGHSTKESWVNARAGDEAMISCVLDIEVTMREWRWAPRYPRCVTTGSTEVVFYRSSVYPWWVDTEDTFHGRLRVSNYNKRELTLLDPRVNDSGTFYCVGEDNQSSSDHLSVSHDCDPEPIQGVDQLGQPMKLSCCESQDPVTWLRDGQTVRNSSGLRFFRNGAVTIPKLGPEHRGLWSCLDEEGEVLVELCLEVKEEQDAPGGAQTTSAPPRGHSTQGAEAKPINPRVVWGVAGVLAAVLFILLMIGIYCCLRRTKMRTAESKKFNGAMEDVNPAGSCHGRDEGATGESKTGSPGSQLPQGAEGHEEIHYSLLEFPMAEGRAETPRAPVNGPVYSEVSRKT